MTKISKNSEKRLTLLKKSEAFKNLRGVCIRLEMHYYRNGNIVMKELMAERLAKVVECIYNISVELKPLNDEARKEYNQSDVHNFLMNSKGMNGREILIENSLSKKQLFILTAPVL